MGLIRGWGVWLLLATVSPAAWARGDWWVQAQLNADAFAPDAAGSSHRDQQMVDTGHVQQRVPLISNVMATVSFPLVSDAAGGGSVNAIPGRLQATGSAAGQSNLMELAGGDSNGGGTWGDTLRVTSPTLPTGSFARLRFAVFMSGTLRAPTGNSDVSATAFSSLQLQASRVIDLRVSSVDQPGPVRSLGTYDADVHVGDALNLVGAMGITTFATTQTVPPGAVASASGAGDALFSVESLTRGVSFTVESSANLTPLRADTNYDGIVDFGDLLTLAQHYGQFSTTGRLDGDLNGDFIVNFDDLLILAQDYGQTLMAAPPAAPALANIPEASSLIVFIAAATASLRRPRRPAGAGRTSRSRQLLVASCQWSAPSRRRSADTDLGFSQSTFSNGPPWCRQGITRVSPETPRQPAAPVR